MPLCLIGISSNKSKPGQQRAVLCTLCCSERAWELAARVASTDRAGFSCGALLSARLLLESCWVCLTYLPSELPHLFPASITQAAWDLSIVLPRTAHLFYWSLKLNAKISFQKKKKKKKNRDRALLSFNNAVWVYQLCLDAWFHSYKSGTQMPIANMHRSFPRTLLFLPFFVFSFSFSFLHSRSGWHYSGYWK